MLDEYKETSFSVAVAKATADGLFWPQRGKKAIFVSLPNIYLPQKCLFSGHNVIINKTTCIHIHLHKESILFFNSSMIQHFFKSFTH